MGIVKVDLLGLGMMAVLQDAIGMINDGSGFRGDSGLKAQGLGEAQDSGLTTQGSGLRAQGANTVDLAHLPGGDPNVYRMLCEADTIGVFQVESRAQMATLPRLRPTGFYDIVVQVAIIRPGPIVGQMVHPYLNRRAGREPVTYPHPSLEPILARTLGVPLFQEQLLRMAMVAAGFTGGQAEELRRAFGFKRSERRMKQIEVQLRDGMARQGIDGAATEQIITSITSFALYGFPESHAASFALLAYASAYLKAHYPAAFYTALLNNQPMGFYHPATLVKDAQRRGVRFHPIDVQLSDWDCVVECDGAIRLGLRYVNGLRQQIGQIIASAPSRRETGSVRSVRFVSLDDLVARTGLRRPEVVTLADIGALNAFGYDRRSALWQAERAVRPSGELFDEAGEVGRTGEADDEVNGACGYAERGPGKPERSISVSSRWGRAPSASEKKDDFCPLRPMTEAERIVADFAGMGLTVGRHPMALRREGLAMRGVLRASDLRVARHGRRVRVAGMVITRQRPGTAKGFVFLTLEDETGVANIIVRPDLFARDRLTIIEEPFLLVDGILQNQDGVTSVRADRLIGMRGTGGAGHGRDEMDDLDFWPHDFY
jgi:error-prone DNA polymerase